MAALDGARVLERHTGRHVIDHRTHSQPGTPVFNLAHLRTYTLGNAEFEHEILNLFLEQLPVTLAALEAAQSAKDWHMAAHTLKGSALAVGASQLAAASGAAEQLAFAHGLANTVDPLRSTLVAIRSAIDDVRTEIGRLRHSLG